VFQQALAEAIREQERINRVRPKKESSPAKGGLRGSIYSERAPT